eukprot:3067886-Rhodomonas_salina.1
MHRCYSFWAWSRCAGSPRSAPVYGCADAVYGCTCPIYAAIYGCTAPIHECPPPMHGCTASIYESVALVWIHLKLRTEPPVLKPSYAATPHIPQYPCTAMLLPAHSYDALSCYATPWYSDLLCAYATRTNCPVLKSAMIATSRPQARAPRHVPVTAHA